MGNAGNVLSWKQENMETETTASQTRRRTLITVPTATNATAKSKKTAKGKRSKKTSLRIKLNNSGLIPEEIVGVTQRSSQLMFIVKWKNLKKPVLVDSSFMYTNHASLVIKYYESISVMIDGANH